MKPSVDAFSQLFAPEPDQSVRPPADGPWKVLLVDDEADIQAVLRLALQDVVVEGRALQLLGARSAADAKVCLSTHPDIAVILLDVVMETEQAGLDLVRHIREDLGNNNVRIVLVTGQPGYAPQRKVVADYAVDGYRLKSELTSDKIFISICTALRNYRAFLELEKQRKQLAVQAETLRKSEDLLKSVTNALPGMVCQFLRTPQGDWKFVYVSKGIETLYEISAEAAYLDHSAFADCILAEDRASHHGSIERAAANLNSWQHEYRIRTPNGNCKWVRGEATPMRQDDGSFLWSGILTDITERKRVAQELETIRKRLELALSGGELGL
jgi:PAS domain S-box-containing protein